MQSKRLEYKPDPNKFDLVTHRWDSQGHLVAKNLYRKFIVGDRSYYERPVNSGNLWYENNQPAGRVEYELNEKGHIAGPKTFNHDAPHKNYTAPLLGAEKMHFELEKERERSAALEAELASIKKERENVAAPQAPEMKVGLGALKGKKE